MKKILLLIIIGLYTLLCHAEQVLVTKEQKFESQVLYQGIMYVKSQNMYYGTTTLAVGGFGGNNNNVRGILNFYVNQIPLDANIVNVNLHLHVTNMLLESTKLYIHAVRSGTIDDWSSLISNGGYSSLIFGELARIDIASNTIGIDISNNALLQYIINNKSKKTGVAFGLKNETESNSNKCIFLASTVSYSYLSVKYTRLINRAEAPNSLSIASIKSDGCTLSWSETTGNASSYNVYIYNEDGTTKKVINVTKQSATISGLSGGTKYKIAVASVDDAGETKLSPTIDLLTVPNAPTTLSSSVGCSSINLLINPSSGVIDGYNVYIDGSIYKKYTESPFFIQGLSKGSTYKVGISAYNNSGESLINTIGITTSSIVPFSTIYDGTYLETPNGWVLMWKASSGASGYIIEQIWPEKKYITTIKNPLATNYFIGLLPPLPNNNLYLFYATPYNGDCLGTSIPMGFRVLTTKTKSLNNTSVDTSEDNEIQFNTTSSTMIVNIDNTLFDYKIYDMNGRIVKSVLNHTGNIEMQDLPNGTYVFTIKFKDKEIIKRVLKQ